LINIFNISDIVFQISTNNGRIFTFGNDSQAARIVGDDKILFTKQTTIQAANESYKVQIELNTEADSGLDIRNQHLWFKWINITDWDFGTEFTTPNITLTGDCIINGLNTRGYNFLLNGYTITSNDTVTIGENPWSDVNQANGTIIAPTVKTSSVSVPSGHTLNLSSSANVNHTGNLSVSSGGIYYAANTSTTVDEHASAGGTYDSRANGTDVFNTLSVSGTFHATNGTTMIDYKRSYDGIYMLYVTSANFNHNNGTVLANNTYGVKSIRWTGTGRPWNFNATGTVDNWLYRNFVVDNDMYVAAGHTFDGSDCAITVIGDAVLDGTLEEPSQAVSFGSLTINSGGQYDATAGVTTITSECVNSDHVDCTVGYAIDNDGTFTANGGTVNITATTTAYSGDNTAVDLAGLPGNLYNLKINTNGQRVMFNPSVTVDNDLTVNNGTFNGNNYVGKALAVIGDVTINDGGAVGIDSYREANTFNFGSLTINSGGLNITRCPLVFIFKL